MAVSSPAPPRLLAAVAILAASVHAVEMLFSRFDEYGTNANTNEVLLTPANVAPGGTFPGGGTFGQKWRTTTDGGACYAQVLYLPSVTIGGAAQPTVFIATNNNGVFALNADTGMQLWTTSVQRAMYGGVVSSLPNVDTMGADNGDDAWGVTSTPVIDTASQSMFVVSTVKEVVAGQAYNHYYHQLFQLSVTTGAVLQFSLLAEETATCPTPPDICTPVAFVSGPTLPNSQAPDATATGGTLHFQVLRQLQRAGLSLLNGNILVVAFAGYDDIVPWHGWVLGFSIDTLAPAFVFITEKNGNAGGVWGAGYKLPVDDDGFMYASVGNGDWSGYMDPFGFPIDGEGGRGAAEAGGS